MGEAEADPLVVLDTLGNLLPPDVRERGDVQIGSSQGRHEAAAVGPVDEVGGQAASRCPLRTRIAAYTSSKVSP